MPLVFVTVFFMLLFCGEGIWSFSCRSAEADALARYNHAEHRHPLGGDRYIDLLG